MYENKRCDRCVAWIETTCINPNTKKVEKSANIKKSLVFARLFLITIKCKRFELF